MRSATRWKKLIEAADESRDQVVSPPAKGGETTAASVPFESPASSSFEEQGDAARATAAMTSSGDVREFFSQLRVRREASGSVVIEAPPEAASTLGALFEGMAALLQSVGNPKV